VVARETLWSIARDRLGSSLRWREIAELNYQVRQSDRGALTEEHWIRPGWTLRLPPPVCQGEADTTGERRTASPSIVEPHFNGPGQPATPIVPFGAGVVGAGVVSLLDRMRRVQQRHRRGGSYIALPSQAQRSFEQRLRLSDGFGIGLDVDSAIRRFVRQWDQSTVPPTVRGVRVGVDVIELIIDGVGGGGGGVVGTEHRSDRSAIDPDSRTYRIDRSELSPVDQVDPSHPLDPTGRSSRRADAPAPLMVTAGQGSDGLIMVNLESLGSLVVEGDPLGCEGVMRALALELATSFWAGKFDLVLAGFGAELERFDRVRTVSDTQALMDQVGRRRLAGAQLLQSTGYRSFAQARCLEGGTRWDPLVVVCGPTMLEADVSELLGAADDPRLGIAVAAAGGMVEAVHVLSLSGSGHASSLELLRSVVSPQRVEAGELDDVVSLVETAGSRQSVLRSDEPYVTLPIPLPRTPAAESTAPDRSSPPVRPVKAVQPTTDATVRGPTLENIEIEVRVLGQIEIRGAAREFTRAWASELVVYLAMHPNGASNEAWATALWPDRLMAPSSLHSTASVARRSLGQGRNGIDHLPRSHGRLALSGTVGTDWARFVALADSEDAERWRSALELIRGRPFDSLRSSDWPILEGIGPAIEAAVVDLSGRLAGSFLSRGDPRGAQWAARQGLLVSPYDERLYRMLMRAADLAGNPAGVESVMSELVRLVADDIEPLDSVHPATMELYRSLTRRRIGSAGPR
jgi:DNA-binding SARP family transcriptional activator